MKMNIIIPVFEEETSIAVKIGELVDFLKTEFKNGECVVTIVDNGSRDKTAEIAGTLAKKYVPVVRFLRARERGIGAALRLGIAGNRAEIVGYMDLDLATNLKHLREVFDAFGDAGTQIVVGSRRLKNSQVRGRKWTRLLTSHCLNWLLKIVLGVKFSDAMCGFKFYRKDIAEKIVARCGNNKTWFFCAEMLIRAEQLGLAIRELPILWTDDRSRKSKVKIFPVTLECLREIYHLSWERR